MVIHCILGVDVLVVPRLLVLLILLLLGRLLLIVVDVVGELLRLLLIQLVLLLLLSLRIVVPWGLGVASLASSDLHQLLSKVVKITLILVVLGRSKIVSSLDTGGGLGREIGVAAVGGGDFGLQVGCSVFVGVLALAGGTLEVLLGEAFAGVLLYHDVEVVGRRDTGLCILLGSR